MTKLFFGRLKLAKALELPGLKTTLSGICFTFNIIITQDKYYRFNNILEWVLSMTLKYKFWSGLALNMFKLLIYKLFNYNTTWILTKDTKHIWIFISVDVQRKWLVFVLSWNWRNNESLLGTKIKDYIWSYLTLICFNVFDYIWRILYSVTTSVQHFRKLYLLFSAWNVMLFLAAVQLSIRHDIRHLEGACKKWKQAWAELWQAQVKLGLAMLDLFITEFKLSFLCYRGHLPFN